MFTNFWYEIYESLKRKPTRAILTGIGIAWGIFILILLVGIGSAFERGVFKIFSGFSKSMTYVYASETSLGYKESQAGKRIAFTEEDLRMLKAGIPEITHISPESSRWSTVYADEKNGRFEIVMMEKPGVDLPTTIAAVFILMISGILAGLKPAIYAAELNPVEALKEEI